MMGPENGGENSKRFCIEIDFFTFFTSETITWSSAQYRWKFSKTEMGKDKYLSLKTKNDAKNREFQWNFQHKKKNIKMHTIISASSITHTIKKKSTQSAERKAIRCKFRECNLLFRPCLFVNLSSVCRSVAWTLGSLFGLGKLRDEWAAREKKSIEIYAMRYFYLAFFPFLLLLFILFYQSVYRFDSVVQAKMYFYFRSSRVCFRFCYWLAVDVIFAGATAAAAAVVVADDFFFWLCTPFFKPMCLIINFFR